MRILSNKYVIGLVCAIFLAALAFGQIQRRSGRGRRQPSRDEYPVWENDSEFQDDVFTFVRVQYDSGGYGRGGGGWSNDYPDCDWNFSLRLHELTSLKVHPNGRVLRLTDPELFDYPFIYMSNVQRMFLSESEAKSLRRYLLNGGFLMADDFWAAEAWRHVEREMKRVFPNRRAHELSLSHEIFHMVYDLEKIPQVPSIRAWAAGEKVERWHGSFEGDEAPHFQGYFDDSGRLMAVFCHNNDVGDGWEREGEDREFFDQFSMKMSYPLGINIVTYAMSH